MADRGPRQRGRGRGYQDAPQQDRQGGGQRGNPRGRGYGPPRGRQERGSYTRQDREPYSRGGGQEGYSRGGGQEGYSRGRGGQEGYSRGRGGQEGYSRGRGQEGYSRGRGYGPPRGDRGGYRGTGDRPSFGTNREWNPFPEGPGSHPKKDVKFDAEAFNLNYKLTITPSSMPPNPGAGKLGQKIKLISNCFALKAPSGYVYHYDVDIFSGNRSTATGADTAKSKKYKCLNTKRNREVVDKMLSSDSLFSGAYGAYDGKKNLLCRIRLGIDSEGQTIPVTMPPRDGNQSGNPDLFEVVVKPVTKKESSDNSINLDTLHAVYGGIIRSAPQDAIMAIETILRNGPCLRFTPVGRSFFYPPLSTDLHPLGGGLEIWFGYHQSVRLGEWTPMVNLDMSSTAFYQERPMLDCIADVLGVEVEELHNIGNINDAQKKTISTKFKNKQIETTHTVGYKRKYRFLKLTGKSADRLEFPLMENGVEVKKTVQRFFREAHNKELKYPHLPCIHVHPEKKNIYLPIEFCDFSKGQHCKKKLDEFQTAEMIKFTARAPSDRFHEIKNIRNDRAKYEDDPLLKGYEEMSVYNEPLQLEARILNVPGVLYNDTHGEKKITPFNGAWDMRGNKYFRGAEINSWVLLSFANPRFCDNQALDKFAKMLCDIASGEGISISRPSCIETFNTRQKSVEAVLRNAKKKYDADLAIVVIPGGSKPIYKEVKQAAETILGLVTQCITDKNLTRNCKPQVVSNLCQKINAKMGGVNNSLMSGELPPVMRDPVMIVGADVTHSSPTSDNNEFGISIAAVVASLDKHPSRYAVTVRAQKHRDENKESIETIVELKSMMVELLKAFYRHTGNQKPRRIIFYRDGVSEGQFDIVQTKEIKAVRDACKEVQKDGYEPAITFLVVQKRHHTRFLPQDNRQGVGRMKNIPPGTTVDTVVTHPLNFDFFLCSHVGIQGTSRPCHYTVLHDDNKFSADDLQKLTFYLCHTYARCTRSISCPSPVMYAHLAAYRATQYLREEASSDTASVSSGASSAREHQLRLERVQKAIKVIGGLADTMYFV